MSEQQEQAKQATCEERIEAQLQKRLDNMIPDIDDLDKDGLKAVADYHGIELSDDDLEESEDGAGEIDLDPWRDRVREEIGDRVRESVLSVDKVIRHRVCLSYGGPADYFDIETDEEGDVTGGAYVFQNWFDGAERRLSVDQARQLADLFCIGRDFE